MSSRRRFSPAPKFVLTVGAMSFFADFTYEASRSIVGQFLGLLGAGALAIAMVTGFGELLGYGLRLFSGRGADRTGRYWPITIVGYILQKSVVPLLALATSWQMAAVLVIAERIGKAIRNPPRDAMLSHAAKQIGYGWGFGVHEALDQFGAMFGPLPVAFVVAATHDDYRLAFAALAVPAAIMLSTLAVARALYPRPEDLEPAATTAQPRGLPPGILGIPVRCRTGGFGFHRLSDHGLPFPTVGRCLGDLYPHLLRRRHGVSGTGSLVFGRLFDRVGIGLLVPLTIVAAPYAPLVFFGGFWSALIGSCLWGLGMGVHESIIPAAVAQMVAPDRRALAYGLFTGAYGIAWFAGSTAIGALFGVSLTAVVIFAVAAELTAIPLIVSLRHLSLNPWMGR